MSLERGSITKGKLYFDLGKMIFINRAIDVHKKHRHRRVYLNRIEYSLFAPALPVTLLCLQFLKPTAVEIFRNFQDTNFEIHQ